MNLRNHRLYLLQGALSLLYFASAAFAFVQEGFTMLTLQCMAGTVLTAVFIYLDRHFQWNIPAVLYALFSVFLFSAVFLGNVFHFYESVPPWDTFLHILSGVTFAFTAAWLVSRAVHDPHTTLTQIHPVLLIIFCFTCSLALSTLWEFYEYLWDNFADTNMQRYALSSGMRLVGHRALYDTMKDLMAGAAGAGVGTILGVRWLYGEGHF